jgi:general secretion pathway protein A
VRHEDSTTSAEPSGYEDYFGLAESPFKLTSSLRFLFESASYRAALQELSYSLSRREPIIVVTGPIGTGKTTLCRMLGERRSPRSVVAVISAPPQTVDDLFRHVLDGFDLLTDEIKPVVEASRYGLVKVFQQFLDSLVGLNAQAILVFDEAQHLPPEILEEIRLLSNLDTDHQTLQIVLVGQPELDGLLARADLTQVNQRISRRHRLEPLQLSEVPAYVDRRLGVAQIEQRTGDKPAFTEAAMEAIATLSHGVPRVVNILCDRSLENAWSDQTHTVDVMAVARAARALNIHVPPPIVTPPAATPPLVTPALATPNIMRQSTPESAPERAIRIPANKTVRVKRWQAQIAIAAVLVVSALLVWIVLGRATVPTDRSTTSPPAAVRDAGRSAPAERPAARALAPPVVAEANPRPAGLPQASATAEKFLIVVSSFRTHDRSVQVAADIAKIGLPASVRTASGWEQVVVGPYASRQDAVAAQGRLEGAHFADTKIEPSAAVPAGAR